jgi:NAD(P)-dependent dehydrogenase (short-subunit alcohol dehydrogenase family)
MSLDKKIIVTGGTYGMGSNIVKGLVREGATVSSMARSADIGDRLAAEVTAEGPGQALAGQARRQSDWRHPWPRRG